MVKHIVCFKLKEPTAQKCAELKETLLSMEGRVPQLRSIEVGVDFLHSDRSYDICLIVCVDDRAALEAYQKDEYHCSAVKPVMHAAREASVAVDFEF